MTRSLTLIQPVSARAGILFVGWLLLCRSGWSDEIGKPVFPGKAWQEQKPASVGLAAGKLEEARKYALTGGGSGCVVRYGRLVKQWGDQSRTYDLKSTSKSIGVTALGLAIADGK